MAGYFIWNGVDSRTMGITDMLFFPAKAGRSDEVIEIPGREPFFILNNTRKIIEIGRAHV